MEEFVNSVMGEISEDFKISLEEEGNYCVLKSFRFNDDNIPDYSKKIIQQYYLLRYFPAYLAEYYEIYSDVIRTNFLGNEFNILSIGCGSAIDLYGVHYAVEDSNYDIEIKYTGLDIIEWDYWYECHEEAYFIHDDIGNLYEFNEDMYNIIIFPKSIGEFSESDFEKLKECIRNSRFINDRIVFIASLRNTRIDLDMGRAEEVINIIADKGYEILDDINTYTHFNQKDNGWNYYINEIVPNLKYPEEIKEFMIKFYKGCQGYIENNGECCERKCEEVFTRKPITTMSQVAYEIIRLEKKRGLN